MIKLSVLTLLAFAAISVHAKLPPVPVPIDEVLLIQDFKANVFDLEFGSANELSPVQTLNHKLRTSAQGVCYAFLIIMRVELNGDNFSG
jgi:hypothetical protein